MRRTWFGRAFSGLFAVWFALSLAGPAVLHSCPVHAGLAIGAASGHSGAAHSHATHGEQGGKQDAHHSCTCLGDCSAGGGVASLPARSIELVAAVSRPGSVALPPAARTRVTAAPHVLPFANGPPNA